MTSRVALITGGTRGIGQGIAFRLAREGWRLALVHRSAAVPARATLAEVRRRSPDSITIRADVRDEKQAARAVAASVRAFGRLDALVNNVGDFYLSPISRMKLDEWRDLFASNLDTAFHCTKYALPVMRRRRSGVIVNLGGPVAQTVRGNRNNFPYAMAKTGLVIFTKSLAQAEAANGIRVNIVNPGYIRTYAYTPKEIRESSRQVPMGRMGTPQDIAAAVSFLVSDDASYITGAALDVCGGLWV